MDLALLSSDFLNSARVMFWLPREEGLLFVDRSGAAAEAIVLSSFNSCKMQPGQEAK